MLYGYMVENKDLLNIQEKTRWTFDTQGCMEFIKLCMKKLKSMSGVSKVTSTNNLITIEFESKDKVSKGKSECDKIFKYCLDSISKKYPDKDFSYGLDVVNDNSISYNVDCMKSYEDVKEAAYIQEGFLDKFRKKNRKKKTKSNNNQPPVNTVEKDEATYNARKEDLEKVNKIIESLLTKYKSSIPSGIGLSLDSSNFSLGDKFKDQEKYMIDQLEEEKEDFYNGHTDTIQVASADIRLFKGFKEISELTDDRKYREEVNKLWDLLNKFSNELVTKVENDKSLLGIIYCDGDKYELYYYYTI